MVVLITGSLKQSGCHQYVTATNRPRRDSSRTAHSRQVYIIKWQLFNYGESYGILWGMSEASAHTGAGRQSLVADNHLVILGGEFEGRLAPSKTNYESVNRSNPTNVSNFHIFRQFRFVPYNKIIVPTRLNKTPT
jgi:hypothetical protein